MAICEKCGKEHDGSYGSGRFCSRSCANSRVQTKEINAKRSNTLKNTYTLIPKVSKINITNGVRNSKIPCNDKIPDGWHRGYTINSINSSKRNLQNIESLKVSHAHNDRWDDVLLDFNIKKRGSTSGFYSRNNKSYAELFWEKVLISNDIRYTEDVKIQKPGRGIYRLDFLVGSNIDLEIDGSVHLQLDCWNKDRIRDVYLKNKGYIVYRIPWINPFNDINKSIVKEQIDNLLLFLEINSL